jgi:DNA-binding response OmpR family regulator
MKSVKGRDTALTSGFDDYLTKRFDPGLLVSAINGYMTTAIEMPWPEKM